jgi:hypothetical protein
VAALTGAYPFSTRPLLVQPNCAEIAKQKMATKHVNGVVQQYAVALTAGLAVLADSTFADTTITNGGTYTNDNSNTTSSNVNVRVWNDTGMPTMFNDSTLQVQPNEKTPGIYLNDAILFTGSAGTINWKFNNNDVDHGMTNVVSSTASGAQTFALYTGNSGNGDQKSVGFEI